MPSSLRVLYLEDHIDHIALVAEALGLHFPGTQLESTHLIPEALECLIKRNYDVVLANSYINKTPILTHLSELARAASPAPVIVIVGAGDEKAAANTIKQGATDYIVKSRESLELLPYLLQRLLKKKRPATEERSTTAEMTGTKSVNHLLNEIDQLSRRVHQLQETSASEMSIASLREELHQLQNFAQKLAKQIT